MQKKLVSSNISLKLKILAREKENVRKRLVITARKLSVVAKEKEITRKKLIVKARELKRSYETLEKKVLERTKDLAGERAKYTALLENIGDGLIATDKKGKIIFANKASMEILKLKNKNIIDKQLVGVIKMTDESGKLVSNSIRPVNKVLKTGIKITTTATPTDYYYMRGDGSIFPVAVTVTPIMLKGKISGVIEVFRDTTKEKNIDKSKSEFISLASHQLRTPLSIINWHAEMLLTEFLGSVNEKQKKYLDQVYGGSQRMVILVNALLNVSRLELGTFMVDPKPTNIVNLMQAEIAEQKEFIDKKKIKLVYSSAKDIPIVQIDPSLLAMVIQNIFSNSIKYTPEEGSIKISLSLTKDQTKSVLFEISDTGYGIPKRQQEKIFTKCFRADNIIKKDTEGTGLGLYIAKSIVEHSGGKIWFKSEENKGTTFYFTLPIVGMKKKEGTKILR